MKRRIGTIVRMALSGIAIGSVAAPAQAGFLDFLFGQPRPPVYAAPDMGYEPAPRARPQARRASVDRGPPKKVAPPEMGVGPLGPFVNDPTLRSGDVVVTSDGLKLFRGAGGARHNDGQFVAIEDVDYRDAKRAADLASIQKTNRVSLSTVLQEPAAAAPPPITVRAKPGRKGERTASR